MRIAYVCADPGVPVFGRKGCSVHVQEVIAAFLRRGAEVELFASRSGGASLIQSDRLNLHPLPAIAKSDLAAREVAARQADTALATALRQHAPFDFIYQRYSLWSCAGMETARELNTPGILEVNAPLILEQAEHRGLVDRQSAEEMTQRVFAAASAIVAVSEPLADYLNDQEAARGRVHVIHNGVDPRRISPQTVPSLPAPAGVMTIGFVGSMKPWHGLSTLVEAFGLLARRYSAVRLLLVGDGPERERLLRQADQLGIAQTIVATGAVDPAQISGLLTSMDIAVAPYPALPDFYFSPLKVFEYMAAGLPVVTSGIESLSALVEDGVTGLHYTAGQAASLADRLETLCRDPALRQRLGETARDWVVQTHTWDAVAGEILKLAVDATALEPICLEAAG